MNTAAKEKRTRRWQPTPRLRTATTVAVLVLLCWHGVVGQQVSSVPYRVLSCRHKPAADIERMLREILPADDAVHMVVDSKRNQILLHGPDEAIRVATELMRSVDRPPSATQTTIESYVQAYPCPAARQPEVVGRLRAQFARTENVRVTADSGTDRVFVLAPPPIHEVIQRQLAQNPKSATGGEASDSTAPSRPPTPAPVASPVNGANRGGRPPRRLQQPDEVRPLDTETREALVPLVSDPLEVEHRLTTLLGRRLQRFRQNDRAVYRLKLNPVEHVDFAFDVRRRGVQVTATDRMFRQVAQLISALDRAGRDPSRRTSIVSIERSDPVKVRKAVDAFLDRGNAGPRDNDSSSHAPTHPYGGVRRVALLQAGEAANGGGAEEPVAEEERPAGETDLRDLGVEVEVEMLPDLDVIILRGRDREVQKLAEIIQELERLSEETQPKVTIYQLRHAQSEAISQIIESVSEDLVGGRQGRVSVTPLVKPNALLLIGWGEAVDSIIALIGRLDTPVAPDSQFAVFRLRHAPAANARQTLQEFFANRTGLGPKVQVTADTRSNALIVYAAPRDMEEVRQLIESLDAPDSGFVNRVRIFKIRNALATELATTLQSAIEAARGGDGQTPTAIVELLTKEQQGERLLRSGILNEVRITPNVRNNTIIVSGPANSMTLVAALVAELDTPGAVSQIKVFEIINADAASMVQMLRSLIPVGTGASTAQLPTAEGETSLAPLRFSVDLRTNSIIATGSEGDLRIVDALLTRLDGDDLAQRKNAVYRLKNAPALEVATAINQFLRSERLVQESFPGEASPFEQIELEVVVVPEPIVNALIISATPRFFDDVITLVEQLDASPPQVMIRVLIAEVTLNSTDEFGVELGLQDSVLFDRSLLEDIQTTTQTGQQSTEQGIITVTEEIIQAATNTPGFNFNNVPLGNSGSRDALAEKNIVGSQGLSNFAVGRMNSELGFGGLVLAASSDSVNLLVRALKESNRLQILSRPQIRTLDNQSAFIQVGARVPRVISTTINQIGQTNSVALENVGLILGVTPRISPDGTVVMEIDAEKSNVGPEAQGIPISIGPDGTVIRAPQINTTQAQATVSAGNGETIILGGLITNSTEEFHRRVPYLSDIPVLGNLFRYDGTGEKRTELLIILTPTVIHTPEDSEQIKQTELARMSWCASQVFDMYGDLGYRFDTLQPASDSGTEIIYPDDNPSGMPPQLPAPAPEPADPFPPLNDPNLSGYDRPADEQEPLARRTAGAFAGRPSAEGVRGRQSPWRERPLEMSDQPRIARSIGTATYEQNTMADPNLRRLPQPDDARVVR